MTRVAVTGVGAVTPLGLDAPSTWRAAVAGESGIDWIQAFDTTGLPVRIAAEVKGFDPPAVASPKEARKLERFVLIALAAAQEALDRRRARPTSTRRGSGSSSARRSAA